jgi:hypothetical protein
MRRIAIQIEALPGVRFVLLVGLVGGALQGIPRFLLSGTAAPAPRLAGVLVVGISVVVWWTAALFLWWIAVRRRRWSLWTTATHVTLGLALADVLTSALGLVAGSIDTNGRLALLIARDPWNFASSNLVSALIRSPLWFFGAALAVALGRHLDGGQQANIPPQSTATPAVGSSSRH